LPLPAFHATSPNKKDHAVANEKSQNVQDVFLNHVRKNKTPVTVFLVNGVKLQGIITWFDNFSVLLRRDGHTQLVYKHAISTVMPGAPIQLFDAAKAEPGATAAMPQRELTPAAGD
jgi:host factor-I protein